MTETWRSIRDYPDYEVSNYGRVRALERTAKNGRRYRPRVLKLVKHDAAGHLKVYLGRKARYVHDLVLETFVGPRPSGQESRHRNGVASDNREQNLQWGARMQNVHDAMLHGVHQKGGQNGQAKLTEADVARAIELRRHGVSISKIAAAVGVSRAHMSSVLARRYWRHVEVPDGQQQLRGEGAT